MKERFKVEYIFTKEVLYEIAIETDKKESTVTRILLVASAILNIIYCISFKIRAPQHSVPLMNVIAILVVTIMAWKLDKVDWYIYWLVRGKRVIGKRQAVLFYDDYFRVENDNKSNKTNIGYSEIRKVLQTENGFIIIYKRFDIWVGNISFIVGDPYEFKKFLQPKLKKEIEISKSIRKSKK